ncbi:unnamed protein product [Closterium sp. Yama58-4]|nr:unnamed protein product [Closterium sp. Yama58-4]
MDSPGCSRFGGAGDMDVLLMAAGTLGDVLPFLALAMHLAVRYGHRVRLASHAEYGPLVLQCMQRMVDDHDEGERHGRGGDGGQGGTREYKEEGDEEGVMVRNGGVFPRSFSELRLLRQQYRAILESTWPACTAAFPHPAGPRPPSTGRACEAGNGIGGEERHVEGDAVTGNGNEHGDRHGDGRGEGERPWQSAGEGVGTGARGSSSRRFRPHAIIANPPAAGHVHCAQKLGAHLHILFTMPWRPTGAYAHPFSPSALRSLAFLSPAWVRARVHRGSYRLVEAFVGAGVMDITNQGPAPLFLAYGSMQLSRPCYVARCVLKAVALLGVRAIIGSAAIHQHRCCSSSHCLVAGGRIRRGGKGRAGVGRMGEEGGGKSGGKGRRGKRSERNVGGREAGGSVEGGGSQGGAEEGGGVGEGGGEGECEVVRQGSVLFVGSVAHDWLVPHCSATVHHGGAGTVAASIRAGCPILPMPFFGDQHFWAAVLHSLGVAPPALPIHRISPRRLLSSLRLLLQPALKARAMQLKSSFLLEGDGLLRAAHSFHLHLPPRLRCLLLEGPEQADRVRGGSRASEVVGLCGYPVSCRGGELEGVHDSCVGSSPQQDQQGVAGQEVEEEMRVQEAEVEVEALPRRGRVVPKSWVFWKRKGHQEQPSDSQEASWEGESTAAWDRVLYQRRSHALFIAMYKVPSAIARLFTSKPNVAQA